MTTDILTYRDIVGLLMVLALSILVAVALIFIFVHSFDIRLPRHKKQKPSREALITELHSLAERNKLLEQENRLLMEENYRLRRNCK